MAALEEPRPPLNQPADPLDPLSAASVTDLARRIAGTLAGVREIVIVGVARRRVEAETGKAVLAGMAVLEDDLHRLMGQQAAVLGACLTAARLTDEAHRLALGEATHAVIQSWPGEN